MAFSHSDYTFSHVMKSTTDTSRPVVFSVDLMDLIHQDGHSALFSIDSMTITAYRQGSWDKVPVKFALLNGNKTRVITYDPTKLSSKWSVDLGLNDNSVSYKDHRDQLSVNIAWLENEPFNRTMPIYADENKQAALNVLGFMMSQSLWVADKARGALDVVMTSKVPEFTMHCNLCRQQRAVRIRQKGSDTFDSFLSFPLCGDGYVCAPLSGTPADRAYRAVCDIMALIRCAYADKLDILMESSSHSAAEGLYSFDCLPYADQQRDAVIISYSSLKRLTCLYQALSEYADSFAVVDDKTPNVKVLFESCCENIGLVTGSLGITTIYGSTVYDIYHGLCSQHRSGPDAEEDVSPCHLVTSAQLTPQVMLRRIPLSFALTDKMDLDVWRTYFFRRPSALYC